MKFESSILIELHMQVSNTFLDLGEATQGSTHGLISAITQGTLAGDTREGMAEGTRYV